MEVEILCVQRKSAGTETRMHVPRAEQQRPVAAHRSAVSQHREIGMRLDARDVAVQTDRSGERPPQRERSEPAGQPSERQRIGVHVGEHAQHLGAEIESHDAAHDTGAPIAVMMP